VVPYHVDASLNSYCQPSIFVVAQDFVSLVPLRIGLAFQSISLPICEFAATISIGALMLARILFVKSRGQHVMCDFLVLSHRWNWDGLINGDGVSSVEPDM
jgi:hypothetical protein